MLRPKLGCTHHGFPMARNRHSKQLFENQLQLRTYLLYWIASHEPALYQAIIEADKESMKNRSGHGSAMAQVYNHMIMPLANKRDKETQVKWGIKDFKIRFGRDPEGMWLPETGVDIETLETLAENNIKFTILAPHQALRIKKMDDKEWMDVQEGKIDPRRAYLCKPPSGKSISIFFFDQFKFLLPLSEICFQTANRSQTNSWKASRMNPTRRRRYLLSQVTAKCTVTIIHTAT